MIDFERIGKRIRTAGKSDIFFAVALFILIDLAFRARFSWDWDLAAGRIPAFRKPDLNLTFDMPYRSRAYWAIKDLLQHKEVPDLILFGASDVATALTRSEATFLNRRTDEM